MNQKVRSSGEPGNDQPINLCLFTDSLEPSGLGEHMLTLAADFLERYCILFVCPPSQHGNELLRRAETLGCTPFVLEGENESDTYARLGQALLDADIQIFHCHAGIGWEGHLGIQTARAQQVPAIIRTEHLPYLLTDPAQRAAYQNLIAQVDHFVCVSAEAYASYLDTEIPHDKLSVVRNGIRAPFAPSDRTGVRQEFGLAPTTQLVLTVARMTEQKGHSYLLDAIPSIVSQKPDVAFVWVGEGPQEAQLSDHMKRLGVDSDHLIFAGWRQDVPRLLGAADLFVLPSLFEGLPLVVLEAMARSVPVIATRVCGTTEAIIDGESGCLVPPRDSQALSEAILTALSDTQLSASWASNAKWRFQQEFSAQRMVSETEQIYQAVLKRNQPQNRRKKRQPGPRSPTHADGVARHRSPSRPANIGERQPERNPSWIASA